MKSVSVILLLGALYALETIQCATVYVVDFQFFFSVLVSVDSFRLLFTLIECSFMLLGTPRHDLDKEHLGGF